jgi:hypothetical protein
MVGRIWRGWTRREDSDEYLAYVEATGMAEYRSTPGNQAPGSFGGTTASAPSS